MESTSAPDVLGGDGSWKSMGMEIESLLEKLLDVNDSMSRAAAAAPTVSVTQKLARHRDILHEFTQVWCLLFTHKHTHIRKRNGSLSYILLYLRSIIYLFLIF